MLSSLIVVFHKLNAFLSTISGELLKQSVELVLLTLVGYMLFVEWRKKQDRELKYLIVGFFALAVARLIAVLFLSQAVFENFFKLFLLDKFTVLINGLEILAVIWIANTFMYGISDKDEVRKKLRLETIILILGIIFMEVLWVIRLQHLPRSGFLFNFPFAIFEGVKLIILIYPVYYRFKHKVQDVYYNKATIAFVVYSFTPLFNLIRHLFFHGVSGKLTILAHPFPFLAIVLFIRAIFLKLADKRLIETELELTKKKYEETKRLTRIKDEFVSIVNHELRTPLTSIKLYLALLRDKKLGPVTAKQNTAIETMNKESNRLLALINDILDVAKLEDKDADKNIKLNTRECDLHTLLDHQAYKTLADEKHITIVNKIPKGFKVSIDGERFQQIFVNLFSNAVKYTPEQGTICFGATRNRIFKTWQFWIADNGRGIAPEHLKHIFDRFYQADDYLTRKEGGTGLGLTIVKHLVELHRGKIEVSSQLNKGTKFVITIPNSISG